MNLRLPQCLVGESFKLEPRFDHFKQSLLSEACIWADLAADKRAHCSLLNLMNNYGNTVSPEVSATGLDR